MVMKLRIPAPIWDGDGNPAKAGKCLQVAAPTPTHDPFFGDGPDADMQDALELCNGDNDGVICPIRNECLIFALVNNEHYGVWGGMFIHDRHKLRRFTKREDWAWQPPTDPDADLLLLLLDESSLLVA